MLCLCLCHVLSFTYVFTDHLLVSFTYHLPVGLSVSEAARVRAHFDFFFEWFSKGSLQKYMNEPCFSFGCVVRLPLFFWWSNISGVEVIFRPARVPGVCIRPGRRIRRGHQRPSFSLWLSHTNGIFVAWILHTATHMYPQICAAQSVKREASVAATCSFFRPWRTLVSYDQVRDYHRSIRISITRNCCGKCYVVSLECADVP